jgi:murein DD-endopeptidase MepM/ murein hydrolase activator NlpD
LPAHGARTHTRYSHSLRLLTGGLAFVFLVTVGLTSTSPTEATNWSRQIGATRASQLAYEGAMRGADRKLKSLARARKQTQRKLKSGKRNLSRARDRRAALGARYTDTREAYTTASRAYEASRIKPPDIDTAAALLAPALLAMARDRDPGDLEEPGHSDGTEERDSAVHDRGLLASSLSASVVVADVEVSSNDVERLKKQTKKQKRAFAKAKKKARRVARNLRTRTRSLSANKRQRSATIARRESAEAGLASRILSMSRLAQHRVAKKTKVRPGQNSGFAWPTRGRISQSYGCTGFYLNPSRGSCRHFHDGLDIVGYRGSPIRSAAVGVVSYIGWNPWDQRGRAFMIVVAHPGGYETLYGHVLPTRRVRVGQLVKKGEVIGYMGNTGRSTGVHVHLELRRGRTTINPLAFL